MKKKVFGRQFKRDTNERKALFKGLMESLVMHESIQTTEEKAKAIKGQVEKLITLAKKRGNEAKRFLQAYLTADAAEKVIKDLSPRFAKRSGGYTRIIKMGKRFSDDAKMAVIEWVEKKELEVKNQELGKDKKTKNKAEKVELKKIEAKKEEPKEKEKKVVVKAKKTEKKEVK